MISFYHDEIEFTDPAFGTLYGNDAKNMWRMICSKANNFSLFTLFFSLGKAAKTTLMFFIPTVLASSCVLIILAFEVGEKETFSR